MNPHRILAADAPRIVKWFETQGGIAIWSSINLSNPSASWTTPKDGQKPSWEAANTPSRIITDPADVIVDEPKEARRFHVAIRPSAQDMSFKLTDASTARVRKAVATCGLDAWYVFDYDRQDAVIFVPGRSTPLNEWVAERA